MSDKRCPVCWRPIPIAENFRFGHHHDKAGNSCPMSGRYLQGPDRTTEPLQGKEIANHGQRIHADEPRHLVQ